MLELGVVRPSTSPWSSGVTLAPKKDGVTRFCIDYRRLNSMTRKDAHPNIQDMFESLRGATVFTTLDLKSGYWLVPLEEASTEKTAFVFVCFVFGVV